LQKGWGQSTKAKKEVLMSKEKKEVKATGKKAEEVKKTGGIITTSSSFRATMFYKVKSIITSITYY